jgi:hypothetical protein
LKAIHELIVVGADSIGKIETTSRIRVAVATNGSFANIAGQIEHDNSRPQRGFQNENFIVDYHNPSRTREEKPRIFTSEFFFFFFGFIASQFWRPKHANEMPGARLKNNDSVIARGANVKKPFVQAQSRSCAEQVRFGSKGANIRHVVLVIHADARAKVLRHIEELSVSANTKRLKPRAVDTIGGDTIDELQMEN